MRFFNLAAIITALFLAGCTIKPQPPQTLLFASDRAGNGDIFAMDGGGRLTNLTHSDTGEWSPRWSPDGRRIAFTAHRSGNADIWLMNADGSNPRNLTNHPAWDYSPAWSPDGQRIAFVSERDGDAEIFVQTLDGSPAEQLTHNNHQDKLPSWSPGGDALVFAAVVNGIERPYRLNLATKKVSPLLSTNLNGTNPVFSPSGKKIAFIGWQDTDTINIFVLEPETGSLQKIFSDTAWLGSLSWSADGAWLFFTARQRGNHNLMALRLADGAVFRLTGAPAWDDFAALSPLSPPFAPPPAEPLAEPPPPAADFIFGVNLADLANAYLVQDMHFGAIKGYINWATVEAQPGEFRWTDPDNVLKAADGANAAVLLRVHGTPAWARPPNSAESHPPTDPADFAQFLSALAARYRGRVAAYEIWNEPNLGYEWGNQPPDPAAYTTLLQAAYRAIKTADPTALVISGGLAPTAGDDFPVAMSDLDFLAGMYAAGARGNFDALGSHIYTFGQSPDTTSANPDDITFERVAHQHEIMLAHGDTSPVWVTEMGWNITAPRTVSDDHRWGVSELRQAEYLTRAYGKIRTEMPWISAAFLFNLDFSAAPWYTADNPMRWYAILNPDRTPRPAMTQLTILRKE